MKAQYWVVIVLIIIILLYMNKNTIKAAVTRGYKNFNPGNIRPEQPVEKIWIGQKPKSTDPGFKQFVSMPYGYRAMFTNLKGYMANGYNTIEKIISTWAPAKDHNDTAAYIAAVTKKVGIPQTQQIKFTDTPIIRKLVQAISEQENGIPVNIADMDEGYKLLTA
jgi:hypothetical protein